jgi:hypothetical protein
VVIKTQKDEGLIFDLAETFDILRKFKMKLNPEKCTFGVPLGKLLGVIPRSKETKPKLPYLCRGSYITHTVTHHGKIDAMFD